MPAPSDEFSLTVGPRGPTVLHDHYGTSVDAQLGTRVAAGLGHGSGSANGSRASIEASEMVAGPRQPGLMKGSVTATLPRRVLSVGMTREPSDQHA